MSCVKRRGGARIPGRLALALVLDGASRTEASRAAGTDRQTLRQNRLAIHLFETYADMVDACCQAWRQFIEDPGAMASITKRDRAIVSRFMTVGIIRQFPVVPAKAGIQGMAKFSGLFDKIRIPASAGMTNF